jgi:hypothetical protein
MESFAKQIGTDLYFRTVHVDIFILFKNEPMHFFFNKNLYSHLKRKKKKKCLLKHSIKTQRVAVSTL